MRGQYVAGAVDGKPAVGYREEPTVDADVDTETYVALKLLIDNWRWADVPFYLRTGKRLARRVSEIAIRFKSPPLLLFRDAACADQVVPNTLIVRIQPDEGIALRFQAKLPGPDLSVGLVRMDFKYADYFGATPSTGYETLLYDVMTGDPTLFHRADMVETGWEVVAPHPRHVGEDAGRRRAVPGVVVGTAVGAGAARARRARVADAVSDGAAEPFERRVVVAADAAALTVAAAGHLRRGIAEAIAARGACWIALAGGRTPRAVYERLAEAGTPAIDWTRVHVAFGDERVVPPDHADSNYAMARAALFDRVPLPASQIHRIEGERGDAAAAADAYAAALSRAFALAPGRLARLRPRAARRRARRPHRVAVPAHAGARRRRSPGRRGDRAGRADVARHADLPGPERGARAS